MSVTQTLFKKITSVSLFFKIMGIALFIIIIFGAGTIVNTAIVTDRFFENQLKERLLINAKYFSSQITDFIITGDLAKINEIVKDTLNLHKDILYIILLDRKGRVLFNSTGRQLSDEFLMANSIDVQNYNIETIKSEMGIVYDIITPISYGKYGFVRIGASAESSRKWSMEIIRRLMTFFVFVAILGILISYTLAYILNIPIKNLLNAVEKIRNGDLSIRAKPWFEDEIGRLSNEFNNMAETIEQEQAKRKELIKRLINSQEEERLNISRELHDRTGQTLISIKIALKSLENIIKDESIKKRFTEFADMLNSTLEDIRSLSIELRSPVLSDFGLFKAVEEEIKGYQDHYRDIRFIYKIDERLLNKRFDRDIEIQLFRIFQEAVRNAIRHSGAKQIEVEFDIDNEKFTMTVADNGKGIENDKGGDKKGGIGIYGMRERAEFIGGIFKIDSERGRGTNVQVILPEIEKRS